MKTPPLLLGAALVFWGWQTGLLAAGIVMAVALESARVVQARREFSDDDFRRLWTFCTLLFLATAVYAFTDNGGPARFGNLLQNPNSANQTGAGVASARTAAAILRWLPMVLFPFMAAQAYSARREIPLTTISLLVRRRHKKSRELGRVSPPPRSFNAAFPYFGVCLFAASIHAGDDNNYFWGLCVLMAWALWSRRSQRYGFAVWAVTFGLAVALGYFGQLGLGQLQSYMQTLDSRLLALLVRHHTRRTESQTAIGEVGRLNLPGRVARRA